MAEGKTAKLILEEVLTPAMVREIWSVNFVDAIPFTLQDFSVGALLPATLYMFRRGYRRGSGGFRQAYAPEPSEVQGARRRGRAPATLSPSAASVSRKLSSDRTRFVGFEESFQKDILADLLLSHCLENQRHESGRDKELIRAFPTHYMSAWIDLPAAIGHLRSVPEMLVGLLADQKSGEVLDASKPQKTWFPVGATFNDNLLLGVLGPGMSARTLGNDLMEDFDEGTRVGVDQLLTIRVAQQCGGAPKRLTEGKGSSAIFNQHPVARQAARAFNEDLRIFLQSYGRSVPRHSFLPMLESCISVGLTNLLLSTALALFEWEGNGALPTEQSPWPLFVDCSNSAHYGLRKLAEESYDDTQRRLHRFPIVLMALRILSYKARLRLKDELPAGRPDGTDKINVLGEILHGRHPKSDRILDDLDEACTLLGEKLDEDAVAEDAAEILRSDSRGATSVMRLAEATTLLMGEKLQIRHILRCLSSCLMVGDKNGLAVERRVAFKTLTRGKKTGMARSIVLSNTVLDYLVHRHLRRAAKKGQTKANPLSFSDFLTLLRKRYGFYVDQAPPGQHISAELLLMNRQILEGRLRDLGLLIGVNDAEAMKRLRPRFDHLGVEVNLEEEVDNVS